MVTVKQLKKLLEVVALSAIFAFAVQPSCSAIGVDWDSNIVTAVGVGSAPEYAIKPGQANALARRAATVDAYRNLTTIIYGIEVENHTTIEQLTVKKDTIKTAVEGAIRNARVVDEEQLDDSNYQVTVSMPLFGEKGLSSAIWQGKNETIANQPMVSAPVNPVQESSATNAAVPATATTSVAGTAPIPAGAYTGLIVDCRGLGLERAMAPNIIDTSGRTLYDSRNISSQQIVHNGLASYAKSPKDEAVNIAGLNPLTLKGTSLADFHRNPVISQEDGNRLIQAVQQYDFLRTGAVVFIQ